MPRTKVSDRLRAFVEGNGYEVITMSDLGRSAVPMDTEEALAELDALEAVVEAAYVAKHKGVYEPLHNALRDLERLPLRQSDPTKVSGKFPTEAEQAAWWAGYSTSEQAVERLIEALQLIAEPPRTDWMPGEYPLVINKMREIAREALERTP